MSKKNKPSEGKKKVCLRCGIDKMEVGLKCKAWGKYYGNHKWGEFKEGCD